MLFREPGGAMCLLFIPVQRLRQHFVSAHLVARPADDGREDSSGRVVSGEPSLAHAGAIVDHQRRNVVVTHGC